MPFSYAFLNSSVGSALVSYSDASGSIPAKDLFFFLFSPFFPFFNLDYRSQSTTRSLLFGSAARTRLYVRVYCRILCSILALHTAVKTKNSRINSFLGSIRLLEFIVRVWNRYSTGEDRYFFQICLYLGQFPQRFCMQKKS